MKAAAQAYLDAGWDVIPYAKGEKGPRETDWTTKRYTADDFTDDSNIGLRLSSFVDVDCDVPEAAAAALHLLPPTKRRHGRAGKPHSHFFYVPDRAITTIQFRDVDKAMVVELRGQTKSQTPAQTMIPPSVHPSGEVLRWEVEESLDTPVNADHLVQCVRAIAAVAICVRHWPSLGGRHEARLALAGYLLRGKVSEATTTKVLEVITRLTHGNIQDAYKAVSDTVAKITDGAAKIIVGAGALRELLGTHVVRTLGQILDFEDNATAETVDELNSRHFVIRVGRDELVGQDDGRDLVFQTPSAVAFRYENQRVVAGTKKTKDGDVPILKSKFEVWREHPDRRAYRTLTFAPPPLTAHAEDYNLWRGFAIEPKAGDCSKLLAHISDIICADNTEHANYLLDLLAFGVQQPGLQSEIATVLRGQQGTGKGILVRTYGDLFGKHFIHLTKKEQLTGKFNEQLSGKCVVFADEAFFAGDPTISGPLKAVITEPTIQIERKGVDQYTETNCIKLFMATNSEWAVPAEFRERRMFVLDVADTRMQDHDYFEDLMTEIRSGGREAFLATLLARPVDRKALRKAPITDGLRSQQDLSLRTELRWWKECLATGTLGAEAWPEWISTQDLTWAYLAWCRAYNISRRANSIELLKRLGPMLKDAEAARGYAFRRDEEGRRTNDRVQCRGWRLPTLKQARRRFDLERGSRSRWDDPEFVQSVIDEREASFEF